MADTSRGSIAILSIGSMGHGIAQLLQAHDYRIITNISDRSSATQERARSANLTLVGTDEELVAQADYVLSIVPPRDAVATAQRIERAISRARTDEKELWYLDLNAISPTTARAIHRSFSANAPHVRFVDGGIIGGPPVQSSSESSGWKRPGIPLSGPQSLESAPVHGAHLAQTLNTRYLGPEIGRASGLKCCFAALSKGFTALALQSFTTASSLDVLDSLFHYLEIYSPEMKVKAEKGVVGCTGKAYRWVEEMNQIGECFAEEGGFREKAQVFRQIAGVYEKLADVVERTSADDMRNTEGVVRILGDDLRGQASSS